MSILIKGMEMPKRGHIEIQIYADGRVIVNPIYACRRVVGRAVPVPPHGRLDDLDDFAKRMKSLVGKAESDEFYLGAVWYSTLVRHIELTPTIIPAEEDEPNMDEATAEFAQYCEMYEPTYDPGTGAM